MIGGLAQQAQIAKQVQGVAGATARDGQQEGTGNGLDRGEERQGCQAVASGWEKRGLLAQQIVIGAKSIF